jgi:hypothetical protein
MLRGSQQPKCQSLDEKAKQETSMTKLIPLALLALALTAGAPAAMADNRYDQRLEDWSKACKGFNCDSQEGQRAFWLQQQD